MIQVQFRLAIVAGREQLDLDVLTRADTTAEERMIAESLLENWQARMLDVMVKHRPMRTYPVRRRTCGECATKDVCKRWQHPDDVGCPFVEAPNTGLHRTEPAAGSGTVRGLVGNSESSKGK